MEQTGRRSFTVKTENGDIRLMSQSEVNDFVKKTIQRAKVTSSSMLPDSSRAKSPSNRMTLFALPKTTELEDRESTTSSLVATLGGPVGDIESRDDDRDEIMNRTTGRQRNSSSSSPPPPNEVLTILPEQRPRKLSSSRKSPDHAERVREIRQSMIRARQRREVRKSHATKPTKNKSRNAASPATMSRFDGRVSPEQRKKQFSWSTGGGDEDESSSAGGIVGEYVSSNALDLRQRDVNAAERLLPQRKANRSKQQGTPKQIELPVKTTVQPIISTAAATAAAAAATIQNENNTEKETKDKRHRKAFLSRQIKSGVDGTPRPKESKKETKTREKRKTLSHDEIRKIVMASMERAQQSARTEIEGMVVKGGKGKTPDGKEPDHLIFQKEVASVALDAMHRARESAQNEIRRLVKESFRHAPESQQAEIRQTVRESMQKARESAKEEMSGLVRKIVKQHSKTPRDKSIPSGVKLENDEGISATTIEKTLRKDYPSKRRSMLVSRGHKNDDAGNVEAITPCQATQDSTDLVSENVATSLAGRPPGFELSSKRCAVYLSPGPGRLDYQFFGSETNETGPTVNKRRTQDLVPFDEACAKAKEIVWSTVQQDHNKLEREKVQHVTKLTLETTDDDNPTDRTEEKQVILDSVKSAPGGKQDLSSPLNSMAGEAAGRESQKPGCLPKQGDPVSVSESPVHLRRTLSPENPLSDSFHNLETSPGTPQPLRGEKEVDPVSPVALTTSSPTQPHKSTSMAENEEPISSELNNERQMSPSKVESAPRFLSTPRSVRMQGQLSNVVQEQVLAGVEQENHVSVMPASVPSPLERVPSSLKAPARSSGDVFALPKQDLKTESVIETNHGSVAQKSKPELLQQGVVDAKSSDSRSNTSNGNLSVNENNASTITASAGALLQPSPTKRLAAVPQVPATDQGANRRHLLERSGSPQSSKLTALTEQIEPTAATHQAVRRKTPKRSLPAPEVTLVASVSAGEASPHTTGAGVMSSGPRSPFARPNRRGTMASPLTSTTDSDNGNLADDSLSPANRSRAPSKIFEVGKKDGSLETSGVKAEKPFRSGLLSRAQRSKSTPRLNARLRSPYSAKNMQRSSSVPKGQLPKPPLRQVGLQVTTASSEESLWTDAESPMKSRDTPRDTPRATFPKFGSHRQSGNEDKTNPNLVFKDSESIVTDEFLARIASRKGSRITAAELQMLLETTRDERVRSDVIETVLSSASSRGSEIIAVRYRQDRTCLGFWDFWGATDGPMDGRDLLGEDASGPTTWLRSRDDEDDDYDSEIVSYEDAVAIRSTRPSFSFSGSDESRDDEDSLITYEEEEDEQERNESGWSWWYR